MLDNTLWALIGLILFLGVLAYFGVFRRLTGLLDERAAKIARSLEEARHLREEARALLADYQKKRLAAEKEAEDIVESAKAEAARMAAEAELALEEMIARKTRAVEAKIALAQQHALAEVKATAADVAIEAARRILADKVKGDVAARLVNETIAEVKTRLN